MSLNLSHHRYQFPVGQGGFHLGALWCTRRPPVFHQAALTYVYDCGSLHAEPRDREVRRAERWTKDRAIDLLFLSHLHRDHVNGLPRLLQGWRGKAQTIVLPYLDEVERVLVFAQSLATRGIPADREEADFFVDLIDHPATALSQRFGPDRIIFVRGGSGEPELPDAGPDPDRPPEEPIALKLDLPESDGMDVFLDGDVGHTVGGTEMRLVRDRQPFRVFAGRKLLWLLLTHVDGDREAKFDFLNASVEAFGPNETVEGMKARFRDHDERRRILTDRSLRAKLRKAYEIMIRRRSGRADLNLSTMSLYSGPVPGQEFDSYSRLNWGSFAGIQRYGARTRQQRRTVGWLGTGDADLRDDRRRAMFLDYFAHVLPEVRTLTIPHHGAAPNFHPELVERVQPRVAAIMADRYKNWQHPAAEVVQSLVSSGALPALVTGSEGSSISERFNIGFPNGARDDWWVLPDIYFDFVELELA